MKKRDLKKLAVLGITSGLLISNQVTADSMGEDSFDNYNFEKASPSSHCLGKNGCPGFVDKCKGKGGCGNFKDACKGKGGCGGLTADVDPDKSPYQPPGDKNEGSMNYHLMTEQELLRELNDNGIRMYKSLSPEGKALALKVASNSCKGSNECKNLNACRSEKNSCAGKGDCAGKGICAVSDKNLAVKLVYDKMNAKRANMTK